MPRKVFYWAHRQECLLKTQEYKQRPEARALFNRHRREKGWNRNYYLKHQEACLKKASENTKRRWRAQRTNLIITLGGHCLLCGEEDIRVLELHHWNGKTNRSIKKRTEEEIKDLVVLCGNCHNLVHFKRRYCFK